jgi:DNA-binding MarR family transcriptional regulator
MNTPPLLGALLRLANQAITQEFAKWLGTSSYNDLQPAHTAATHALWIAPGGARLTTLAQTARITKQSMAALVEHLLQTGYVERATDPDDGRASLLRLTARGRAFVEDARAFASRVETNWRKRVGARRIRELRETLAMILEGEAGD